MRAILRAGAIALAASSLLLTGAVAAQAAPAAGIDFKVSRLVFAPNDHGHAGTIQIEIHNGTSETWMGGLRIDEPIARTFGGSDDLTCLFNTLPDGRWSSFCDADPIPAGETKTVTVTFRSPAAPRPFARISAQAGSVRVEGVTQNFPALFRSTTGSVADPVPYTPQTHQDLTVTAGGVTLTRQEDGTFRGSLPVTLHNNNDAPHYDLKGQIAIPAGLDPYPYAPEGICVVGTDLPVPPGGSGASCSLDNQLGEGETRTVEWLLTAPADAPVGPLGTGITSADLANSTAEPQSDGANQDTFAITLAG